MTTSDYAPSPPNGQKTSHAAAQLVRMARAGRSSLGRVLDVGCGYGQLMAAAREYSETLTGADTDGEALERCKRRMPGAQFIQGDVRCDLDVPDATFDTIFFCDVIEHLPNPFEPLATIGRKLAPQGRVVVTTPNAGGLMRTFGGDRWFALSDESHILFFTRFTLDHTLRKAGFRVLRSQTWNSTPFMPLNAVLRRVGLGGSLVTIADMPL